MEQNHNRALRNSLSFKNKLQTDLLMVNFMNLVQLLN